jgi:hypothetical protein
MSIQCLRALQPSQKGLAIQGIAMKFRAIEAWRNIRVPEIVASHASIKCGTLESLTRAREEREGETVMRTEGSVKKPRLGCLYLRKREHASAAVR